jgi:hypothetical protein
MEKLLELEKRLKETKEQLNKQSTTLEKSHKKVTEILNDYESDENPKFKRSHIKNAFKPSEVKQIVDAHSADPHYEKDSTIQTVSNAYHKAVETEKSEVIKFDTNGQWSLDKAEGDNLSSHKNYLQGNKDKTQWGTASHVKEAATAHRKSSKNPTTVYNAEGRMINIVNSSGKNKGKGVI